MRAGPPNEASRLFSRPYVPPIVTGITGVTNP